MVVHLIAPSLDAQPSWYTKIRIRCTTIMVYKNSYQIAKLWAKWIDKLVMLYQYIKPYSLFKKLLDSETKLVNT